MYFYDLVAEQEAIEWYSNELLLPTIKSFLQLFKKEPIILDLGCGTGHETMRLKKEGALVVGLDFSSESIKIAKYRNPELKFHCMKYDEITNDLGTFDGIFASASLIHQDKIELKETIKRIRKVHKNNGYFLNLFQKGEGKKVHYPEIKGIKIERIVERYTKEEMIDIFNNSGYSFEKELIIEDDPKDVWMCLVFKKRIES